MFNYSDDFGDMVSLHVLNLSNNEITKIPKKNIDILSSLHELDVSNNQIEEFPEEFEYLHLQKVNFANNNLLELPGSIRNVC